MMEMHRIDVEPALARAGRTGAGSTPTLIALAAACLLVSACGSGSPGNDKSVAAVTVTPQQAGDGLGASLNALTGAEANLPKGSGPLVSDVTWSFAVQGFAFCIPTDPYVVPISPAPAGQTVYGCANNVTASVALDTGNNTLTVTLNAAGVYVDFNGNLTIGTTVVPYDGALVATSPSLTVVFNVMLQPDGNYKLGSVSSTVFNGTWEASLTDSTLEADHYLVSSVMGPAVNMELQTVAWNVAASYGPGVAEIKP